MASNLPLIIIIFVILLSGCAKNTPLQSEQNVEAKAIALCTSLCEKLKNNLDLKNGPCLSDKNPEWNISGWVCDVAHSPRQEVDNKRENQCEEWWKGFNEGNAPRFVEVDPECKFIRTG
jgi:hypothetical protein